MPRPNVACACGPEHAVSDHCDGRKDYGCPSPRDLCHVAVYCNKCSRQWDVTCTPRHPKGSR